MKTKLYILTMLTTLGVPLAAGNLPKTEMSAIQGNPRKVSRPLPFFEGFDNASALDAFKVIDKNKDGSTWFWHEDGHARCKNASDDWLLTPMFHLEADHTYILSFKYWKGYWPERIAVAFGMGDDPDGYTIMNEGIDIPKETDDNVFTQEVTVTKTGEYRFGVHGITPADGRRFYIAIDSMSVKEGSAVSAPDSVTKFHLKAGPQGKHWANVDMYAPLTDGNGQKLDKLDKVELLLNGTVVKTFGQVKPGDRLQTRIDGGKEGLNTYTAIAYNAKGAGRKADKDVYLGIDIPQPPKKIRLIDNGSNYTVEWTKSDTIGVHGGYVDASQLTYTVYNVVNEVIQADIADTVFVNDDATPYKVTGVTKYDVAATNKVGTGKKGMSNYICTGKPSRLPFLESFEKAKTSSDVLWWWQYDTQKNWRCTSELSYDNDGGCLRFKGENNGEEGWLCTGKISLQKVASPYLNFAYYALPGSPNKIEVIASKMQNEDIVIATIDFSQLEGSEGWRKAFIPVKGMGDVEFVVLRFHAIVNDAKDAVAIDAIELKDRKETDLAAMLSGPDAVVVNKPSGFVVKVSNEGSREASDYMVEFYADKKLVDKQIGRAVKPMEEISYTFNYTPGVCSNEDILFQAVVKKENDEYPVNNHSQTMSVMVVKNDHFDNTTLRGELAGDDVVLSWDAVVQKETKTEDFEGYKAWSIDYIGPWKVIDGDKAFTYGIKGVAFPHYADPFAYIVFNPEAAGIDLKENTMIAPHGGSQFLGCFASDPEFAPEGHNDDWLISPLLNGKGQVVTLWAKSLFPESPQGKSLKEHILVLGSSEGNDMADLKKPLADIDEIPAEWTKYSVEIPSGTKYFAIRTVSADKFLLMLDDITYSPKLMTIKGFNVYRDGTFLSFVPAGTLGYTDKGQADKDHIYRITVVYEEGESGLSNTYTVSTGVDESSVSAVNVTAGKGRIVVRGADGMRLQVVSTDGMTVFEGVADASASVPVRSGTYVVKVGNTTKKLIVE